MAEGKGNMEWVNINYSLIFPLAGELRYIRIYVKFFPSPFPRYIVYIASVDLFYNLSMANRALRKECI